MILCISRGSEVELSNIETDSSDIVYSFVYNLLYNILLYTILLEKSVRYCLRETVFANMFLRLFSILCDTIVRPRRFFCVWRSLQCNRLCCQADAEQYVQSLVPHSVVTQAPRVCTFLHELFPMHCKRPVLQNRCIRMQR